MKWASW